MRATQTIAAALLLTIAVVAFAAPPAAAAQTCHDSLCCQIFEPKGVYFAECVVCVSVQGYWNVDTNQCYFP